MPEVHSLIKLKRMEAAQIRDILEVTSKLESAFRHIRTLCGRYLQMQNGGNLYPSYNQYTVPFGYSHTPNFMGPQSFYPPPPNYYEKNMANQQVQKNNLTIRKPSNANNTAKTVTLKKQQDQSGNTTLNKGLIQAQKGQKINVPQKKTEQIVLGNGEKINKSISNNGSKPGNTQKGVSANPGNQSVPTSAYHIFLFKKKQQIKKEYPQLNQEQLSQIMSQVWKSFNADEKKPYQLQWRKLKYLASTRNEDRKQVSKPSTSQIARNLKNQLLK